MTLDDLPPAVQQLLATPRTDDEDPFVEFGKAIALKRKEAVDARKASGIEELWMECEEAYLGIDELNRAEFASAKWAKPPSMDGPLRARSGPDGVKSTAFVRLTARYVDAGAAKIGEITQPIDDKSFSLTATPDPDLIKGKDDQRGITDGGVPVMRDADEPPTPSDASQPAPQAQAAQSAPGMMAPAAPQPAVPGQPAPAPAQQQVTVADLAQHVLDVAADSAKKAETRIYDWMVEYGHAAEMRKVTFDASRIGTGIIKGPVPDISKATSISKAQDGSISLQFEEKIVPVAKWVDPWNFFPDDSCGEDIHDGGFTFERDFLSPSKLKGLASKPGYIAKAIAEVIKEGPDKDSTQGKNPGDSQSGQLKNKRYTIWYFYGEITLAELALANPDEAVAVATSRMAVANAQASAKTAALQAKTPDTPVDPLDPDPINDSVFVIGTMVNETMIRCVVNPLESGSFPYHVVNWRRRAGHWAGVGVGEQCRLPQRMVNAATRAMLNNAGQSAGAITVLDRGCIESSVTGGDNEWAMTPGKLFFKNGDSTMDDVKKAFAFFTVPNMTPQLMTIIDYAFKLAEESTSIPLITQGQSGNNDPDTFGGLQLQNNNANQLLRDVGFAFADGITAPLVTQFYEWLLLDPDVNDDEKGDFKVNVNPSVAMIERAIQDQTIAQMSSLLTNSAFGIDPKKWFASYARSKRLDPRDFQFSPEQMEKIDATPPPDPVPVQVAKINTQANEQIQAAHDKVQMAKTQEQSDRGTQYVAAQTARDQANAEAQLKETEAQVQIANLNYQESLANFANARGISTDQAKAQIAQTAMKLQVQKEISMNDLSVDLHKHHVAPAQPPVLTPPTEPAGKAPAGEAFAA